MDSKNWIDLSHQQRSILAYAPKPTSIISTIVCSWVSISIFRDKKKMSKMYHRLALAMCISSAMNSFFYFVSSWSVPKGTYGCIGAVGTKLTCTITGFFHQLGFVVQFYYVSLSFYVYVALKCEFRLKEIEWMEKYIHMAVFVFPLGSGIYLAAINMFNPVGFGCWISYPPPDCDDVKQNCPINTDQMYITIFGVLPMILNFLIAGGLILASYVRERRKCTNQRASRRLSGKQIIFEIARQHKAKLVARQGVIYLGVFFFSYAMVMVAAIIHAVKDAFYFPTLFLALVFHPIDGFFFTLSYLTLLSRQKQELTVEFRDEDKVHKQTFSMKKKSSRTSIEKMEEAEEKKILPSFGVSLFDGTDEEKWKAFGVYCGSSSDSDCDDDYLTDLHFIEIMDEDDTVKSMPSSNPEHEHQHQHQTNTCNTTESNFGLEVTNM